MSKESYQGFAYHKLATTVTIKVDYGATEIFIVPGGRYLVSCSSNNSISVLDLGYTSSADCNLITSVGPEGSRSTCIVQATQDGMGLIIFSSNAQVCLYLITY